MQLDLKKTIISLLPITEKVIDTTIGKIPGTFVGFFTKILENALKEETRIDCYQFHDVFVELLSRKLQMPISK